MKTIEKAGYLTMTIIFILGMMAGMSIGKTIYRSALIDCQIEKMDNLLN